MRCYCDSETCAVNDRHAAIKIVKSAYKVCRNSADKITMFGVLKSFVSQLQNVKQDMFKVPDAARRVDSSWYVGMAIHPAEFSQQLSRMQLSLQSEQPPVAVHVARK
jgi:hypothetical protein